MLNAENPGEPDEYGFVGIVPVINRKIFADLILQPESIKHGGRRIYRVVIGGILFLFLVPKPADGSDAQKAFVQPDGTWVLIARDIKRIPFLDQWLEGAANKT